MRSKVLHLPNSHALNRVEESLRLRIIRAQTELLDDEFRHAGELCSRAFSDLKIAVKPPAELRTQTAAQLGDLPAKDLQRVFSKTLAKNGVPPQAITMQATTLTHRVQLLRAFRDPDQVISDTCQKVSEIVAGFPKSADDIRCGRNPGDVLDPYIFGAAQFLMCAGDFEGTIAATVSHKVLMMIEGLLGHLHEDVIGAMRGNFRTPEPRGVDQETLDPLTNPFPGADIMQPPLSKGRPLRFHQVKSKTGSAKGGDGRRLGVQLTKLQNLYGGEIYYDALIGNTLRGHRSMAGVQRAAPNVVVLVGDAAFRELTGCAVGPQLLLRLYQSAFEVAAQQSGYRIQNIVATIFAAFRERADELQEGFLESLLHDAINGPTSEQDSRNFVPARHRKRGAEQSSLPD